MFKIALVQDNLLLYSHERLIGGVRGFKRALESENEKKRDDEEEAGNADGNGSRKRGKGGHVHSPSQSHQLPAKLFFDEALGDGPEAGKDYLLSLMFSHFDQNNNGALEYEELHKVCRNSFLPSSSKLQ
jgi:hypothetical protein